MTQHYAGEEFLSNELDTSRLNFEEGASFTAGRADEQQDHVQRDDSHDEENG
jgi:hypothetical protein